MDFKAVGIDIAKDAMDVCLEGQATARVEQTPEAIAALVNRLKAAAPDLVVMEATGGLELPLAGALTVDAAFGAMTREFRPEDLPKVRSMTFAAAHNNPAAGAV